MGVAVAAAGSLAGGLAGQAIMGKPQTYTGGGIPGVTATKAQGGKGGDKGGIPQVDPSYAIQLFQQAASTQTSYYKEGLKYYETAIKDAMLTANTYYSKANETLRPLSEASNAAMNEQLKMLGLPPVSATAGLAGTLKEAGILNNDVNALADKMAEAEGIKDPQQRAAAKAAVQNQYEELSNKYNLSGDPTKLGAFTPESLDSMYGRTGGIYDRLMAKAKRETSNAQDFNTWYSQLLERPDLQYVKQDFANEIQKENMAAYQAKLDAATGVAGLTYDEAAKRWETQQNLLPTVRDAYNTFQSKYAETPETGYTGSQIEQRLAATPGYQWQMEQGTRAIERQGAARGMLGSANTQIALQEYGQGLAMNTYQGYMQNLANIVNQGSGATAQIANNQVSQGQYLGGLIESRGNVQNQTSQLIGNAQAQSLYKQGETYYDAAKYNTGLQYKWLQADKGRQADMAQAQMNAGAQGYANDINQQLANLAQSRFNYQVYQNQQAGGAFKGAF